MEVDISICVGTVKIHFNSVRSLKIFHAAAHIHKYNAPIDKQ